MASQAFYAVQRHHTPDWILKKIADLTDKAKRLNDSSNVLYACLEARNLLEMLGSSKLQCSVSAEDREALLVALKPQNGIKGVDKELKALGLKTQEFMHAVTELQGFDFPVFNFNECDKLIHRLSQYIHTYTVDHDDMIFGSDYINQGFVVIDEAVAFAMHNLIRNSDTQTVGIVNAEMGNLPDWAKLLLGDWKSGKIKDRKILLSSIDEASKSYIEGLDSGKSPQKG